MTWQRTARRSAIWGVFLSLSTSLWAQNNDLILPKGITPWEVEQWLSSPESQFPQGLSRGIPNPPEGSDIRTAAEWEEIEVLTITWRSFPCILKQITAAAVDECRVVIFSEDVEETESYLTSSSCGGSVSLNNVEVVNAESNSIWIRDYGANTVYTEFHDGRVLVDWLYNRPRPDDDAIPDALSAHMGIPLHSTIQAPNDLMSTGGNWMSMGLAPPSRPSSSSRKIQEVLPSTGVNNGAPTPTKTRQASTTWCKPSTGWTPTSKWTCFPTTASTTSTCT